jgi:hypothetical protein
LTPRFALGPNAAFGLFMFGHLNLPAYGVNGVIAVS